MGGRVAAHIVIVTAKEPFDGRNISLIRVGSWVIKMVQLNFLNHTPVSLYEPHLERLTIQKSAKVSVPGSYHLAKKVLATASTASEAVRPFLVASRLLRFPVDAHLCQERAEIRHDDEDDPPP